MRKSLCLLAGILLLTSAAVQAQIQKGNVLVGGDIANFQLGLNKGGLVNIVIDPKAAWFVQDNVAFGGYALLGVTSAKDAGTSTSYGVGALGRYYAGPRSIIPVRNARFFVESSVGFEGFNPEFGDNTNGIALGVGPGVAYFITPNVGIEGLLKYKAIVGLGDEAAASNLGLNVGFQVYLPRRKVESTINNITQ